MAGKMCIVEDALLIAQAGNQETKLIRSPNNKQTLSLAQYKACSEFDHRYQQG
jgi:hypothetical protein